MVKIFLLTLPVFLSLFIAPTISYSLITPSWIEECETCVVMELAMAETNCPFNFDQIIDISQTDMPRDQKKEVVSKLVNEFFECAAPEQEEEIRKELIPTMLIEIIELAENNTKLTERVVNLTEQIADQNTRIIELENEGSSLAIGLFFGGIPVGFIISIVVLKKFSKK